MIVCDFHKCFTLEGTTYDTCMFAKSYLKGKIVISHPPKGLYLKRKTIYEVHMIYIFHYLLWPLFVYFM